MSGWLYVIRNRDLYKIGITKNFENRMRQLKPDKVVAKLYTKEFLNLERELHRRYKKFRIPQTEYFRLENHHLKEIIQRISKLDYPFNLFLDILFKSLVFIILISLLIFILLSLYISDLDVITLKSLFLTERITFIRSFFSLFLHSGKYLSFLSELKYRLSSFILFIIFALLFKSAYIFLK